MRTFLFFILSVTGIYAQEKYRVTITPFNFHVDNSAKTTHFSTISHLNAQGNRLYISSEKDAYVLMVDLGEGVSKVIGTKGSGPGELSLGALASVPDGESLWVQDSGRPKSILHFKKGDYKETLKIFSEGTTNSSTSNRFGAHDGRLVFPLTPRSHNLAANYKGDEKKQFGELAFGEDDAELLRVCRDMNETIWVHGDGHWYALFAFTPVLQKYNENFKLVDSFDVKHPYLQQKYSDVLDFKPSHPSMQPHPLFTDMTWRHGRLFLQSKFLYEIDPQNGTLISVTSFFRKDPKSDQLHGPLNLNRMALLENGTLILGHKAMPWGHDLWQVQDPPFLK